MFFSKPKNVLGIDIGTSYVKAVELKPGSSRPFLVSYGMVNVVLPRGSGGKIDAIGQIAEVIQALHEKANFTTKKAVISLPSNIAFVSVFDFPQMSEEELGRAVEYKAKQFIPLPLSDVNFSWQIVEDKSVKNSEQSKVDGTAKIQVLLTAVPKNVVNNYAKVMELAGYEPIAIEIESISAIRSLIGPEEKGAVLIVDVGAKSTILSLSLGRHLYGSRHLSIGGDTITSSIAKSLGITYERAEQLKRSSVDQERDKGGAEAAQNIVESVRTEVVQMIKISENQGKSVSRIILSGGGSRYPSFKKVLRELSIPISDADPLRTIEFNPELGERLKDAGQQLSIAIGLALRSLE